MEELKPNIHDDTNGLDYVLVGDYYIPAVELPEDDDRSIGKWGWMHWAYLEDFEQGTANVERFLALAKKYTDFSELTTPMINEFVDKIIVHAPEKIDGDRTQEVDIYLKFIGRFDLPAPELTPEKDLKQRRLEKRQNRVCKECGKTFTPKRSDAVYCCNACRQRAYRQSVTDKLSGQKYHLIICNG
jgi:ribosomal protein L37AE/L43A|nr:DUF4368 domain-containing protein [uncultured Acetatifactor sp.]